MKTEGGEYIAVGNTQAEDGNYDALIVKFDENLENPIVKTFGGTGEDIFEDIVETEDGEYIAVGSSSSKDGDIKENKGGSDELNVTFDKNLENPEVKTFGGSQSDVLTSAVLTEDGGYVTVGSSKSSDGDIKENKGSYDEFIAKIDGYTVTGAKTGIAQKNTTYNPVQELEVTINKNNTSIDTNDAKFIMTSNVVADTKTSIDTSTSGNHNLTFFYDINGNLLLDTDEAAIESIVTIKSGNSPVILGTEM